MDDTDRPWRDEERLRELYHGEGMSSLEVADELACNKSTVLRWMSRFGIERRQRRDKRTGPWRDEDLLREMYWDEGMSYKEIAERLGCEPPTIHKWLHRNGIPTRAPVYDPKRPPKLHTNANGYEYFDVVCDGERTRVRHHRLIALAHGMIDASELWDEGIDIHHINEIPWDNRPSNLEAMPHGEHRQLHAGTLNR